MSERILDDLKATPGAPAPLPERKTGLSRFKQELHDDLVKSIDLRVVERLPRADLERQLRLRLTALMAERQLPLDRDAQHQLVDDILDDVIGYGPLEQFLRLPGVTDILINGPHKGYIERKGKLEKINVHFRDNDHLLQVIDRIVSRVGRRVDESTPMVDARLPDGSRVNAVIPPAAVDGPMLSIRRFGQDPIRQEDLIRFGSVPAPVMRLLEGCVQAKLNILISGGTGSGKTTLLNVLSSFIPETDRTVTIEDSAELQLQQEHVIRLETRPPNIEGEGEITPRALVRNALRMRPDRIIVGEIRGEEAVDMLQAMNTGHEGSLGTIHANSPRHGLSRLATMVGLSIGNISSDAIREMISDALHLIIQVGRLNDGTRRLLSITEVLGMESGRISTQEIVRFVQETVDDEGRVRGAFVSTGVRPEFALKLQRHGIELPQEVLHLHEEV